MFIIEVVVGGGGCVLECITLTVFPLMYVNVNKILGTPFNIMHPSTPPPPTTTSIINIKSNYHLSDNVNKNWKCISFVNIEFMAELLYWIALDCTGVPNEVVGECIYTVYDSRQYKSTFAPNIHWSQFWWSRSLSTPLSKNQEWFFFHLSIQCLEE